MCVCVGVRMCVCVCVYAYTHRGPEGGNVVFAGLLAFHLIVSHVLHLQDTRAQDVCMYVCLCVCVYVFVCERERERVSVCVCVLS